MMASTQSTSAGGSPTPPGPPPSACSPNINLRNPTPLSATQEAQVRELYYKRVRGLCAAEIKGESNQLTIKTCLIPRSCFAYTILASAPEFAACAINRTVTATWVCRKQRLAMNTCMIEHAKPEEQDRAREE